MTLRKNVFAKDLQCPNSFGPISDGRHVKDAGKRRASFPRNQHDRENRKRRIVENPQNP